MMHHPGKLLSIYEVVECVGFAHETALTPSNIIPAFKKCGIYLFDSNISTDLDFLASSVTAGTPPAENENTSNVMDAGLDPLDLPDFLESSETDVALSEKDNTSNLVDASLYIMEF